MIYIKVPKEIKEYKSKAVLGLTYKQLLYLGSGTFIGVLLSILFLPIVGVNGIGFITFLFISPAIAVGFVTVDGLPMETYLKYWFYYKTKNQVLSYENDSMLYAQKGAITNESIKEGRKERKSRKRRKAEQNKLLEDGTKKTGKTKKKC